MSAKVCNTVAFIPLPLPSISQTAEQADSDYEEFLLQREAEFQQRHKSDTQILERRQSHRAGITSARDGVESPQMNGSAAK